MIPRRALSSSRVFSLPRVCSTAQRFNVPGPSWIGSKTTTKHAFSSSQFRLTQAPTTARKLIESKMSLDGKVTVVTGKYYTEFSRRLYADQRCEGGSRGIGLTLAKTAAALGSDIAILDVQKPEESLAQLEKDHGPRFIFHR